MDDPNKLDGEPLARSGPMRAGCLVVGAVFLALLMIFGVGLGLRHTYWLQISDVQAFEGEDGVVLFVQVQRGMLYSGFLRSPPIKKTMELLRVEIARDGSSSKVPLKFKDGTTFNSNIAPILRLPDHFYLVQGRSKGRSSCQLHRVLPDRIEPLGFDKSGEILRSIGLPLGRTRGLDDFSEFDAISLRHGWTRLNGSSYGFRWDGPIESRRHKLSLRLVIDGTSQSIVADSFDGPDHWSNPLVRVDATPWKSYQSPMW